MLLRSYSIVDVAVIIHVCCSDIYSSALRYYPIGAIIIIIIGNNVQTS